MNFELKKGVEISEEDLGAYHVWATFYEPDELELLEELGFDIEAVNEIISQTENIDEYWFPLPSSAATMPFKYIYVSAKIQTSSGSEFFGYRTRVSLTLLFGGDKYHFNKAAGSLAQEQAQRLSKQINESSIFPLHVYMPALNKNEEFTL